MSPTVEALLRSWPYEPRLTVALVLAAVIYARGWLTLKRRNPRRWIARQPAAFGAALLVLYLALASPIEPLAALMLQAHMLQHLLLMMVAAPLVWLGDPLVPLMHGVPQPLRRQWVLPLVHWHVLRALGRWLVHPAVALPLLVAANWLWHVPRAYELALSSPGWHRLEHGCFLAAALAFWHPVVRPFPGRPAWSQWLLLPYLVLADVQNTLLAALLTFSNRVLYPHYARVPPLAGLTPLLDQSAAGVLMWVPGSIAFLVPLGWIGLKLLLGADTSDSRAAQRSAHPIHVDAQPAPTLPLHQIAGYRAAPAQATRQQPLDLLRLPLLGRFLRWRHARLALQLPAALLAVVIVVDGLWGPQSGAMNLAGVLPWIHWRAVVVLGLLVVGNVSCMACPFTLPRSIARRWLPAGFAWPRPLRSKWLAVGLVALFFWAYEVFDLWDRPWWTAWLVLGYFAAALAVDGLFRGAAFCKYLCPIGQFNFVQSLASPWEVRVREPAACAACHTHDCLHGRGQLHGCELGLFQPRKIGNMDCTFCLDCVHACPHDNVGLLVGALRTGLGDDRLPGLGRLSRRADIAALIGILSFGAFANAAGMVAPVLQWRQAFAMAVGELPPVVVTSAMFLLSWIAAPLAAVMLAAELSRVLGRLPTKRLPLAMRYVYALVPLGFAMWLAHYGFHFFTSYAAAVPAAQRFAGDWGYAALGTPIWTCSCCGPVADWLLPAELLALDLGLLGSLAAGYRLALADAGRPGRAMRVVFPWAVLMGLLFAAGVWIMFQPMQMRGMLGDSG